LCNLHPSSLQNKSKMLPCIEEAWSLPIPAELTSRQGALNTAQAQQACKGEGGPSASNHTDPQASPAKKKRTASPAKMRQQATADAQPRSSLPNGPSADPPHNSSLSHTSPLNHIASRPPCVTHPTANGSCSSSPSAGLPGHLDLKNHTAGLGGGGASNGNVPYPQQNSLPHTCTATSQPSTTSSTNTSPSNADETWRSQQRNTTTQVFHH
ncbi:hypothetical protein GOODEAATRI_015794, partial [Goodea atripinnis]